MFINTSQDSEDEVLSLFAGNECSSILFWHENIPQSQHMTKPAAILQPQKTEKIEKYVYFSARQIRKIIDWRRKKSKLKLAWWLSRSMSCLNSVNYRWLRRIFVQVLLVYTVHLLLTQWLRAK